MISYNTAEDALTSSLSFQTLQRCLRSLSIRAKTELSTEEVRSNSGKTWKHSKIQPRLVSLK